MHEIDEAAKTITDAVDPDANIIFGAVMDEKMKDAVKITVIATGFGEASRARQRQAEVRNSFASSHDDAMDFPEPVGPSQPAASSFSDRSFEQPGMADSAPLVTGPSTAEVISLDAMRNAMVANFEQQDLDVPAFLRKRGEVM